MLSIWMLHILTHLGDLDFKGTTAYEDGSRKERKKEDLPLWQKIIEENTIQKKKKTSMFWNSASETKQQFLHFF